MNDDESELISGPISSVSPYNSVLAGGCAGCIGKTLTAPLSRLTILYQVGPLLKQHVRGAGAIAQENNFMSLLYESKRVVQEEGILAFWKGNLASVMHRFPYSAINFSIYEGVKSLFRSMGYDETPAVRLICGATGGGVACAAAYPLDLVRTRLSVETGATSRRAEGEFGKSRIFGIIRDILRREGPQGLYRGLFVSMSVSVPNLAIGFSVYGTMKEKMLTDPNPFWRRFRTHPSSGSDVPVAMNAPGAMVSGAFGGVISSIIVFPLDVVRRRMQVIGSAQTIGAPKGGALSLLGGIVRQEGVKGLYRGIVPELLKVTPMVGITFCAYEMTLALLKSM